MVTKFVFFLVFITMFNFYYSEDIHLYLLSYILNQVHISRCCKTFTSYKIHRKSPVPESLF